MADTIIRWVDVRLPVVLTPDEGGGFVVSCPVIPGCISQGNSADEAFSNIREAIMVCIEAAEKC